MAAGEGSHLVLPLMRLPSEPEDDRGRGVRPLRTAPRLLHLEDPADTGLASWGCRVREAAEACLLVRADGRVAALSASCAVLLEVDPAAAVGVLLLDLVAMVDFSAVGLPVSDPALHAPPLRVLTSQGMARSLVRLRYPGGRLATFDVVGVALDQGAGALGFFAEV